jgi:hypothetical protein
MSELQAMRLGETLTRHGKALRRRCVIRIPCQVLRRAAGVLVTERRGEALVGELSLAQVEQRRAAPLQHGAYSGRQIIHRATVEKRRLLRQVGLRQSDLESIGRALLQNWARAAAALALMDGYAAGAGWLDEDGNPRGFARLYVSLLNSERLALRALGDHLRAADGDAVERLHDYLATRNG